MHVVGLVAKSLYAAADMFWQMLWALILGFALSGVVIAFVPKSKMVKYLGKAGPKELLTAIFFGSVSSSCSYAAAAMAKSLTQKGASFITALAFMLASTNLVVELSAVLWIMLGWQFVAAEFAGGFLLVFFMAILMRFILPKSALKKAPAHSAAHAHSANSAADPRTVEGWRMVATSFVSEWKMIGKDIALGVLISGFVMVCVPATFWRALFLADSGTKGDFFHLLENALVGPIISVFSFVCSVGNIPLARVLYHSGISFGGTISFIYADLIIIPLILIYRKYYGLKIALWITAVFYVSMVAAGLTIELLFKLLNLVPENHGAMKMDDMHFFSIDSTFYLNLIFVSLALGLLWLAHLKPSRNHSHAASHCH